MQRKWKERRNSRNRIDAQITIIAALSLTLILSFVAAVFQSAQLSALNVHIQQSCRLAEEAVFSGYSNVILDEFDILLLKKSDNLDGKLSQYIQDNLSYEENVTFVSAAFDELDMVTDDGGDNLRKEILAYMKYGVISDAVKELAGTEEQVEKSEKIKEITDKITTCEEAVYQTDVHILKLIQLVEGIKTNDTGLVIRGHKPQPVEEYFVKAAINGEVTMNSAGVNNRQVYDAVNHVTTLYTNVYELINNMTMDAEELAEIGDEESDKMGTLSYAATYRKSYENLGKLIDGVWDKTVQALAVIEQYREASEEAESAIGGVKQSVEESKELIGEEISADLSADLNEMSASVSSSNRKMCDVEEVEEELRQRKIKLDSIKKYLLQLDIPLKQENCSRVKEITAQCTLLFRDFNNDKLKFDYSGIDFNTESDGLSAIRSIYSTLTEGLIKLVLQDKAVSDKKLEVTDLSSKLSGEHSGRESMFYEAVDTALYDEYVLERFKSYTDMLDEDGKYDEDRTGTDLLEYSVEYILCGEDSDRDNLKETILRVSMVREGMNLAYLFTDSEKKAQALALSTTLLGFTGNMAIIKGGQYFIMSVWAYGEAIMDLRQLYSGGRVEMIKKKDNWKLTLENLLCCNLDIQEDDKGKGFSYDDYLRMLLFIENPVEKHYQTMGAMELRLIGKGNIDFRMRDYVCAASGQAVFTRKGIKGYYTRQLKYSYI